MTPPRLHVLTAIGGPAAVILRRGPAEVVATVGWDRDTHTFAPGQWLRGRIYEHRADLSPDGRHMVYFAARGGSQAWTAVSRAPWLRALLFLPQGSTWCGGGAFDPQGRLWLNGGTAPMDLPDGLVAADPHAFPHSTDGFHMGSTHPALLERRGWRREGQGYDAVLTRDLPGDLHLEQRFAIGERNRSIISSRFAVVDARGNRTERPDWEWADLRGDRLQVAARGALHEMPAEAAATGEGARLLRDFSGMAFEAVAAPYEGATA